jgi:hypothetical protein
MAQVDNLRPQARALQLLCPEQLLPQIQFPDYLSGRLKLLSADGERLKAT